MTAIRVFDVMTPDPTALRPDDTIHKAAQAMRDEDIGAIPILDEEDSLIGMVTDRDIVVTALAEGRGLDTPVRHCMTVQPESISRDTTVEQAITLMASRQVRRLPVLEHGRLVGMVSLADITTSAVPAEEKGEAIEEVSRSGSDTRDTRLFPG